jgi:hypothetical protein
VQKTNPLKAFLEYNLLHQNTENPKLLVVDRGVFDNNEASSLNALLDPEGEINGIKLTPETRVVSLCEEVSTDPSFTNRHKVKFQGESLLRKTPLPITKKK